jgi:hypothetical protein
MLLFVLGYQQSSEHSQDGEGEWNHKPRLRYALGLIIVQDVIPIADLGFEETCISIGVHLISKLAIESSEHTSSIPWRVLVRALINAFIAIHDHTSST